MIRHIREAEVRELLSMRTAIEVVAGALVARANGDAYDAPRSATRFPQGSVRVLSALSTELGLIGCKVTYAPGAASGRGHLHLVDVHTGELRATVESVYLSRIRTGAASGVATRALAREDAVNLAVIGAGSQSLAQIEAVCAVRPIRSVRVWSRNGDRLREFSAHARGVIAADVVPVTTARDAVEGSDVIVVITSAAQPVLEGAWLRPGQHVNAAGGNALTRRELDEEAIRRCDRIVVDARDVARAECGDLLPLVQAGVLSWDDLPELGEVLTGRARGRATRDEITLYESHGMGVQDLYAGQYVYASALRGSAGERVST